jgi:hypothetical protein
MLDNVSLDGPTPSAEVPQSCFRLGTPSLQEVTVPDEQKLFLPINHRIALRDHSH